MAITATQIESSNSLEQFRQEFNNLQSDVSGLETGTLSFSTITTTSQNTTTLNVREDGVIIFEGATDDGFETTLTVVDPTADRVLTLPDETGSILTNNSVVNATTATVTANNSTNETIFLTFVDGATGSQGLETDTGLTYNPSTGLLTTTKVLIADAGTIGSASSTSAITIASTGIVTFVDDILIKDAGTIGSATTVDAITIASDGDITTKAELTVGSLFKMPDVTSTKILVADGTSFQEVAISGDATIANTGAVTLAAAAISGKTQITTVDLTNDDLLILDATDGALKKVALTNLGFVTDDPTALAIALG
jgi:hypothetical protein